MLFELFTSFTSGVKPEVNKKTDGRDSDSYGCSLRSLRSASGAILCARACACARSSIVLTNTSERSEQEGLPRRRLWKILFTSAPKAKVNGSEQRRESAACVRFARSEHGVKA